MGVHPFHQLFAQPPGDDQSGNFWDIFEVRVTHNWPNIVVAPPVHHHVKIHMFFGHPDHGLSSGFIQI
ncbi:MAG: hypothetical protein ACI9PY_003036 [Ascidiaceihabitans sp.]